MCANAAVASSAPSPRLRAVVSDKVPRPCECGRKCLRRRKPAEKRERTALAPLSGVVDLPRGGSCVVCSTPRAAAPWGMCRAESRVMSTPRCCGGAAEEGLHVRSLRSKKTDAMHALISAGCARRKGAGEHDGIDEPCFSPERVETASPLPCNTHLAH